MVKYAYFDYEYGRLRIGYNHNVIRVIDRFIGDFSEPLENERSLLSDKAYSELTEYFAGKRAVFDFPIEIIGTDFQRRVWNELIKIPYGETRSYKFIAEAVGNPKACRAVGMAVHCNPLCIVIPCHRVIGSNGSLTGYAGGLDFKEALLKIESTHKERIKT
jgi:methylated-DNA-[protein]-cysteine S-methyltransferase